MRKSESQVSITNRSCSWTLRSFSTVGFGIPIILRAASPALRLGTLKRQCGERQCFVAFSQARLRPVSGPSGPSLACSSGLYLHVYFGVFYLVVLAGQAQTWLLPTCSRYPQLPSFRFPEVQSYARRLLQILACFHDRKDHPGLAKRSTPFTAIFGETTRTRWPTKIFFNILRCAAVFFRNFFSSNQPFTYSLRNL